MVKQLTITDFLAKADAGCVVDVRTPAEYAHAHIPGAINVPLFGNEARVAIGTAYKQQGRSAAIRLGLDLIGGNLSSLLTQTEAAAAGKPLLLYCWRGGMRSGSLAWLLDLYGLPVSTLTGGYKSYRHWALAQLAAARKLLVLAGATGTGKTELLHALRAAGHQVLDLEALANHNGSAFGALGHAPQPTTEQFENLLAGQLQHLDPTRATWVEDESRTIGRITIPDEFWKQMQTAPAVVLQAGMDYRCRRLVAEYGRFTQAELSAALQKIERKLGGLAYRQAQEALHAGDLHTVAQLTLNYYDKAYAKWLAGRKAPITSLNLEQTGKEGLIKTVLSEIGG